MPILNYERKVVLMADYDLLSQAQIFSIFKVYEWEKEMILFKKCCSCNSVSLGTDYSQNSQILMGLQDTRKKTHSYFCKIKFCLRQLKTITLLYSWCSFLTKTLIYLVIFLRSFSAVRFRIHITKLLFPSLLAEILAFCWINSSLKKLPLCLHFFHPSWQGIGNFCWNTLLWNMSTGL